MFWPVDGMTAFPDYVQASVGGVSFPKFAVLNESLTQVQPNYPRRFGQVVIDGDGYMYMYVKANATLALGNAVKLQLATVTGTAQTADATGDGIHVIKTNISGITTKNQECGNFLHFAVSGYTPVIARIKGNTATVAGVTYFTISLKDVRFGRGGFDADAYAAGIANGVAVNLYRPYQVIPTAAAGDVPVGVSMGVVTSGNGTLIMIQGQGLVLSDGSSDALVVNTGLVPNATSGTVKGKHGTFLAGDYGTDLGFALYASSAAATLVPAQITCFGRI